MFRQKIINVIIFVNVKMKFQYDNKHIIFLLKSSDKVFLKFHVDYILFGKHNKKFFQQRCESFIIKRRIDRLTYELNLSPKWKVYSIISVTQLKPHSKNDFYNRFILTHLDFVYVEKNIATNKFYEVKKMINKKIKKYNKTVATKYLIRWLKYKFEFDE